MGLWLGTQKKFVVFPEGCSIETFIIGFILAVTFNLSPD